jgi:hypothetical protein
MFFFVVLFFFLFLLCVLYNKPKKPQKHIEICVDLNEIVHFPKQAQLYESQDFEAFVNSLSYGVNYKGYPFEQLEAIRIARVHLPDTVFRSTEQSKKNNIKNVRKYKSGHWLVGAGIRMNLLDAARADKETLLIDFCEKRSSIISTIILGLEI